MDSQELTPYYLKIFRYIHEGDKFHNELYYLVPEDKVSEWDALQERYNCCGKLSPDQIDRLSVEASDLGCIEYFATEIKVWCNKESIKEYHESLEKWAES